MTDKFIPSTQFIEKLPDICVDLELVSVYDMDCYSVPQLLYRLAQKINDTITNMEHNDLALKAQLEDLQVKLEYLLGEGLMEELTKIFEKMYADGTLQALVEGAIVDINKKIIDLQNEVKLNTDKLDYFVRPEQFKKDTDTDDTKAIIEALSKSKKVVFDNKVYRVNKRLILSGHTLLGCGDGDIYGNDCRIEFYDMPNVESCIHVETMSSMENIKFQYAEWKQDTPKISGITGERRIIAKNCAFLYFPKNGALLYRKQLTPSDLTPYHSNFESCVFAYSGEHNIVIGNGGNAINLTNVKSWYAGATGYKVQPTTKGSYDGLYIDGKIVGLPAGLSMEPQQITITSGDYSYNSNFGINYRHCNETTQIGGYLEHNRGESEINIDSSYGLYILNPMCEKQNPKITTKTISTEENGDIFNYPNTVVIRGKDLGQGDMTSTNFPTILGSNGGKFGFDEGQTGFKFDAAYGGIHPVSLTDKVTLAVKNAQFNTDTPIDYTGIMFNGKDDNEGSAIFDIVTGTSAKADRRFQGFYNVFGDYPSGEATAFRLSANSTTNRSINCGGTVNVTGADYAEYMVKNERCGDIEKGAICGVDIEGKLTDKYNEAVSFIIKSTNPSFVGGDTWQQNRISRDKVDRMAFCGQVPVNIIAPVGSYIVPVNIDNTISIDYVLEPTFEEYKKSLGKVIKQENNKSVVIVKTI